MHIVSALVANAYRHSHNMARQRHIAIGGNHIVLALPPIVTLSEFVAESADKRVEIFAGQIYDLACAKIPSWYSEGGIAVHGITYTRVHLHL